MLENLCIPGYSKKIRSHVFFITYTPLHCQIITIYYNLCIHVTSGTQPAIKPVVPILSQNAVVSVWVQTKSNSITLTGGIQTCVGATCNAHTFFSAVRVAERGHGSILPPVGNDNMGRPCPKTHFVVQVTYLQTNGGRFAQATEANRNALKRFTEITSGLDIARKSAFPERVSQKNYALILQVSFLLTPIINTRFIFLPLCILIFNT